MVLSEVKAFLCKTKLGRTGVGGKEIQQRGIWEDLWQQRSRPGPNPEEVVVNLWSHCCRSGNSCPPAWCHHLHAISDSANTDHHTWWVQTYWADDVTKRLTHNATDVLIMGFEFLSLESSDVQKSVFRQHRPMCCCTVWTYITFKINGDIKIAALGKRNPTIHFKCTSLSFPYFLIQFSFDAALEKMTELVQCIIFCNVYLSCVFDSVRISLRDDSSDATSDKGHQASL